MQNKFVTYNQALTLNKLGFNEPCIGYAVKEGEAKIHCGIKFRVHDEYDLPTKPFGVPLFQDAIDWFQNEHLIYAHIECVIWLHTYRFVIIDANGKEVSKVIEGFIEAKIACIDRLIEKLQVVGHCKIENTEVKQEPKEPSSIIEPVFYPTNTRSVNYRIDDKRYRLDVHKQIIDGDEFVTHQYTVLSKIEKENIESSISLGWRIVKKYKGEYYGITTGIFKRDTAKIFSYMWFLLDCNNVDKSLYFADLSELNVNFLVKKMSNKELEAETHTIKISTTLGVSN